MLQQTTVATVRARYDRFLERFPDVASLSRASEERVLAAWSGLGYYARARNLRLAARELVRRHGGRLPRDPDALRSLPGFGEYMAAAVATLAHGVRVPAADANVTRVLSRLWAIPGVAGTRAHAEKVRRRAADLLAAGRPRDVLAALMDLGQLVCLPRRPACAACPVAESCAARRKGAALRYPARRARPALVRRHVAAAFVPRARDGAALLVRGEGSLLGGLWQFPAAEGASPADARTRLARSVRALGLAVTPGPAIASARHTMVHRRLEISVYRTEVRKPKSEVRHPKSVRWFTPERLERAAIPTLTRRIARAAGVLPGP
ncbi:MAG: A/G-specific adenine glycosylase [Syntrophomonadaceae bacterium]